jgi:hypothetical protein
MAVEAFPAQLQSLATVLLSQLQFHDLVLRPDTMPALQDGPLHGGGPAGVPRGASHQGPCQKHGCSSPTPSPLEIEKTVEKEVEDAMTRMMEDADARS